MSDSGDGSGGGEACGWRQWRHLSREVRKLFNGVRSTRRAKRRPERVEAYLERCRGLVERAVATIDTLRDKGVAASTCQSIQGFIAHARRQVDQVERRLLREGKHCREFVDEVGSEAAWFLAAVAPPLPVASGRYPYAVDGADSRSGASPAPAHHRRMLAREHWVSVPELTAGERSGPLRDEGRSLRLLPARG